MKHRNKLLFILMAIITSCLLINGCSERDGVFVDEKEIARENLGHIAYALNRYFDKFSEYPEEIMMLKEKGFLNRFPFNAFRGRDTQMIKVKVSAPVAGDFSYLKIYRNKKSDQIMRYVLILWGEEGTRGKDILDPNYDYERAHLTSWTELSDGQPDPYIDIILGELRMIIVDEEDTDSVERGKPLF